MSGILPALLRITFTALCVLSAVSPYTDNEQCLSQLSYIENVRCALRSACPSAVRHECRFSLLHGRKWEQLHLQTPVHAHAEIQKDAPRTVHNSLRKFLSLLYEDPKMQILIGEHRVRGYRLAQWLDL